MPPGSPRSSIETANEPLLKPLVDIPRMARIARNMLNDAITAFIEEDAEAARRIAMRDDEVDALYEQVYRELLHLHDGRSVDHQSGHPFALGRSQPRADRRSGHQYLRAGRLCGDGRTHRDQRLDVLTSLATSRSLRNTLTLPRASMSKVAKDKRLTREPRAVAPAPVLGTWVIGIDDGRDEHAKPSPFGSRLYGSEGSRLKTACASSWN